MLAEEDPHAQRKSMSQESEHYAGPFYGTVQRARRPEQTQSSRTLEESFRCQGGRGCKGSEEQAGEKHLFRSRCEALGCVSDQDCSTPDNKDSGWGNLDRDGASLTSASLALRWELYAYPAVNTTQTATTAWKVVVVMSTRDSMASRQVAVAQGL
jgi:hypothetical protein